jgi:hypothetical protein
LGGVGGLTTVEVLAATALVVALVGLVLPRIDVARFHLDSEAQSLALMVRSAQNLATLRRHDIVLSFDEPGAAIRMHNDRDGNGRIDDGEEVRHVALQDRVVFGSGGAPPLTPGSTTVTFSARHDGLPSVTFRGNGRASEGGIVYLTSRVAAEATGHNTHTRALWVEQAGRVTCMSYRTQSWAPEC